MSDPNLLPLTDGTVLDHTLDQIIEGCECDNTHEQNDTVCRWCWAHGRRKWADPEVQKFEVPIVYRGQSNYIVFALDKEGAERRARDRFDSGDKPDDLGNEWEEIERVGDINPVDTGGDS